MHLVHVKSVISAKSLGHELTVSRVPNKMMVLSSGPRSNIQGHLTPTSLEILHFPHAALQLTTAHEILCLYIIAIK